MAKSKIEIPEDKLFACHQQFNQIYGCLLAGQTEGQIKQRFPELIEMLDDIRERMKKYEVKN
jgi:hypothetical protein